MLWPRVQTEIYGLFYEFVAPPGRKSWLLFTSGTCLGALETNVLLSFHRKTLSSLGATELNI